MKAQRAKFLARDPALREGILVHGTAENIRNCAHLQHMQLLRHIPLIISQHAPSRNGDTLVGAHDLILPKRNRPDIVGEGEGKNRPDDRDVRYQLCVLALVVGMIESARHSVVDTANAVLPRGANNHVDVRGGRENAMSRLRNFRIFSFLFTLFKIFSLQSKHFDN